VIHVAAGDDCSVCVLQSGAVTYWGNNWIRGKPGVASKVGRIGVPRAVAAVALGARHLLALGRLGEVWSMGYGEGGQLGTGKLVSFVQDPSVLVFREDVIAVRRPWRVVVVVGRCHPCLFRMTCSSLRAFLPQMQLEV
jgi:alpha-tubulin suppressor-like RCC1 family protein